MNGAEQIELYHEFISSNLYPVLLEVSRKEEESLNVDFSELSKFNVDLAEELLNHPENSIKAIELAVQKFDIQKKVNVRFFNLPKSCEMAISDIRSRHIGKFIKIMGTIRTKTEVRPQVIGAKFECPSCGNVINIAQDDSTFQSPTKCSCGRKGKFKLIETKLIDAQKITLEESHEDLESGAQPKRMDVFLKEDLASPWTDKRRNPGTRVAVYGYVKEIPIILRSGAQSITFQFIIMGNYVEPTEEDFTVIKISPEEENSILELSKDQKIYEKLNQSIAPSIYGHERVKEALVLQMFGGVRKQRDDGVVTRGDTHILLIGDPGSGKCLHGDSKIVLNDGSIERIKDIEENYSGEYFNDGYSFPNKELNIIGFDGYCENQTQKATKIWKRFEERRMLKIKTAFGSEIIVTKNHPFFKTDSGIVYGEEASQLRVEDYIATPRKIEVDSCLQVLSVKYKKGKYNQNKIKIPKIVDNKFARFLGYLVGDGYISYTKSSGVISLTNNENELLSDFVTLANSLFGLNCTIRDAHKGKTAKEAYCHSKELISFLENLEPGLLKGAGGKKIPQIINKSPNNILKEFIKSYVDCDGHLNVKKDQVEIASKSEELIRNLKINLLRFGIISKIELIKRRASNGSKIKRDYYRLIISGEFAELYINEIGFNANKNRIKAEKLKHNNKKRNTNVDIIPNIHSLLKIIKNTHNLYEKEFGISRTTFQHYVRGDRNPSRHSLQIITQHLKNKKIISIWVDILAKIQNSDIFWDKIIEISEVEGNQFVYDFEIQETHNFVANSIMVHNSQLINRLSVVAPKSRFVSGKGVSGAGLTASVIKDEFTGGWALEAGALVLANRGYCMIDEMDKMNKEDRDAMHEALEQQCVSISKANIQATLRCQTTVLAAANPKFGRFDPYGTIAEQIDMPVSLINRFDLIFPIKDLPNKERDATMSKFILKLHQNAIKEKKVVPISTEMIRKYIAYAKQNCKPVLSDETIDEIQEFYVKMRNSGGRDEGIKAVPISARQLEGIIRLAEASAKVRLKKTVDVEDAKRAIDLVQFCLSEIATDRETGKIDIDKLSSGISASARGQIINIKEIINQLTEKIGRDIPIKDIIMEAGIKGMSAEKVEESIEKLKRSGDIFEPRSGFIQKLY